MIYDTGAQVTTMSRELANRLQINYLRTTADVPEFPPKTDPGSVLGGCVLVGQFECHSRSV